MIVFCSTCVCSAMEDILHKFAVPSLPDLATASVSCDTLRTCNICLHAKVEHLGA